MASHVFPKAKELFISTGINLNTATVKVALLDSSYTYSGTDQFRTAITAASIALSPALSGKSETNGVFNASNVTLTAVATAHTIAAIVGYVDSGGAGSDNLLWINDGFSQITNGGDIVVQWDTGANKIFAL